ncbi:MAG: hypothetical protein WD512_06175, partial [Candidatus Paceibacterota bacterium]
GSYTPRFIYEETVSVYNWYLSYSGNNGHISPDDGKAHKHLIIQMIDNLLSVDPANGINLQTLGFNDAKDAYTQCKIVDPSFKYDFDALKCFRVEKGHNKFIVPGLDKTSYFGYSYYSLNLSLSEYFLSIQSRDDTPQRLITKFLNKTLDNSIKFLVEPAPSLLQGLFAPILCVLS